MYDRDAPQVVSSAPDSVVAIRPAVLADHRKLEMEASVTRYYWPRFGRAGKGSATGAQVLGHEAGLAHAVGRPAGRWSA